MSLLSGSCSLCWNHPGYGCEGHSEKEWRVYFQTIKKENKISEKKKRKELKMKRLFLKNKYFRDSISNYLNINKRNIKVTQFIKSIHNMINFSQIYDENYLEKVINGIVNGLPTIQKIQDYRKHEENQFQEQLIEFKRIRNLLRKSS